MLGLDILYAFAICSSRREWSGTFLNENDRLRFPVGAKSFNMMQVHFKRYNGKRSLHLSRNRDSEARLIAFAILDAKSLKY